MMEIINCTNLLHLFDWLESPRKKPELKNARANTLLALQKAYEIGFLEASKAMQTNLENLCNELQKKFIY
jgi:hypothetical protein